MFSHFIFLSMMMTEVGVQYSEPVEEILKRMVPADSNEEQLQLVLAQSQHIICCFPFHAVAPEARKQFVISSSAGRPTMPPRSRHGETVVGDSSERSQSYAFCRVHGASSK